MTTGTRAPGGMCEAHLCVCAVVGSLHACISSFAANRRQQLGAIGCAYAQNLQNAHLFCPPSKRKLALCGATDGTLGPLLSALAAPVARATIAAFTSATRELSRAHRGPLLRAFGAGTLCPRDPARPPCPRPRTNHVHTLHARTGYGRTRSCMASSFKFGRDAVGILQ